MALLTVKCAVLERFDIDLAAFTVVFRDGFEMANGHIDYEGQKRATTATREDTLLGSEELQEIKTTSTRRSVPVEKPASIVLVLCDGLGGYDWSDQAEEGPNYVFIAYTSSSSDSKNIQSDTLYIHSDECKSFQSQHQIALRHGYAVSSLMDTVYWRGLLGSDPEPFSLLVDLNINPLSVTQAEVFQFELLKSLQHQLFRFLEDWEVSSFQFMQIINQEQIQQAACDEVLVLIAVRVKINTTNIRIDPTLTLKEETYLVVLDIIKTSPCYNAFLNYADVLEIYMLQLWFTVKKVKKSSFYQFDLANKKCQVDVELFHKILQICLRVLEEEFVKPPFEESLLTFLIELGYKGQLNQISSIFVDHMHQP
nr:hypothetical protein [Tanacetum cinerariifolium]